MFEKIWKVFVDNNLRVLAMAFVFTMVIGLGLFNVGSKFGPEVWYPESSNLIKTYKSFEQEFGFDETVILSVHSPDGILKPSSLKNIFDLTEKLMGIKGIVHVDSLTHFNNISSKNDDIIIEPLFDGNKDKLNASTVEELKEKVLNHPELPGLLISRDNTTTFIKGYLKPRLGTNNDVSRIIAETRNIVQGFTSDELTIRLHGSAYMTDTIKQTSTNDLKKLLPLLFLIIVTLVYLNFFSLSAVFITLMVLGFTIVTTFGIAGIFAFRFSNLTFTIPIILLSICVADTIHILSTFFKAFQESGDKLSAVKLAYKKNLKPTIMTSLTTAIGFFGLITSESTPIIEMGSVSGGGVIVAWFATYLLIAPLVVLLPISPSRNRLRFKFKWNSLSHIIVKHSSLMVLLFISLSLAGLFSLKNIAIDMNPFDQFSKNSEIRQGNDFVKTKMNGVMGPEFVIDSGSPGGAKEPQFLRKVDELARWIESKPTVDRTRSVLAPLKQMNRILMNDNPDEYRIPESQNAVAESLFLLSMDSHQADLINSQISIDGQRIRLSVSWGIESSEAALEEIDNILKKAKSLGLVAQVSGKQFLSINMVNYIFSTFASSIAVSLFLITLVIILGVKSIKLGLLSIIPNVLPLVMGGMWLVISDLALDLSCVVAFVISLGITVDDTIHYLVAYSENSKLKQEEDRQRKTLEKCGSGILLTTITLVSGFSVLAFSDFVANYKLGVLTVVILTTAIIADLLFLPALFVLKERVRKV